MQSKQSNKNKISSKLVLFSYDHKGLSSRGNNFRKSWLEVKKIIQNIGLEKK